MFAGSGAAVGKSIETSGKNVFRLLLFTAVIRNDTTTFAMLLLSHVLLGLLLPLFATAHSSPKTAEEREVQRALQQAAYHCAPAKVLAGNPSLPAYQDLFADGTYDAESGQELMSCTPVTEEVKMENNTCVLTPIVTEGPYYHQVGHPIRQNIAEYQIGVPLLLDIGVIDVETCKPLPNILVDIWHANATGHYAGHPESTFELRDEKPQVGGKRNGLLSAFPRTKPAETFLRGAWPTNENGVAQFSTIFPGYYTGRATHIHTKAGKLVHVGQFFFDDEINVQVDKMHPYTTNPIKDTVGRTRNWRDSLNIFEDSHGPEGKYNPVFRLELLGGVFNQGFAGFITMGVNTSVEVDNWWKG
ncbi:Intradiol ring-cleavage dioxygenase [Armillaria novae-zelandiae]|uniref:Intradiol ring-cleavage dioxygenase n=1 Tax=Armillaria novae-zelandiae TaxID=153914 RepID=A0AA39NXB8_9AGAR|nr:Intradiol ring-cleavage dioxygenase [Armillaria novae-zelandiae]